jgi:hypothetical protein
MKNWKSLHDIDFNQNPYPHSEEVKSLYNAWAVGWLEAENEMVEYDAGYYL